MAPRQGLVTDPLRPIHGLVLVVYLVLTAIVTTLLLWIRPPEPTAPHLVLLLLIGLTAYAAVIFPLAVGFALGGVTILMVGAVWAVTRAGLLGCDLAAAVVLIGTAIFQQQRRVKRVHRLEEQLDDLGEEVSLKEQAIESGRQSEETLRRKLSRYQQLQTIAEQLSHLVELTTICQLAVDQAFELIGKSDVCLLFLAEPEGQELALHTSKKSPGVAAIRAKHGDQFERYVLRAQRPLLVSDVRRDFRFGISEREERSIASVIACPLRVSDRAEGVLRLDSSQPGAYTQDDLRFLDILLGLIGTSVANARLFAQARELAMTDGLTGLYQRQPFLEQLAREVSRAGRSREPLAVLMLDIDNFKRYNDTFGHTAGDAVLKAVAGAARDAVGPDGIPARYGGEEFVMLLPRSSRKQAVEIAMKIQAAIGQKVRATGYGFGYPVTASLGVAVFPEDAQSDLELIRRSDQRLYHAKRSGKDCVCAS